MIPRGVTFEVINTRTHDFRIDRGDPAHFVVANDGDGAFSCGLARQVGHRRDLSGLADDGLVRETRDGGGNWKSLTPPDMPELASA